MEIQKLIEKKLLQTGNDKYIAKNIKEFIGNNCCQKCYQHCDYPLTHVISFDKSKGNYHFHDFKGANYVLKKFCKQCCCSRASSAPIYIEIN